MRQILAHWRYIVIFLCVVLSMVFAFVVPTYSDSVYVYRQTQPIFFWGGLFIINLLVAAILLRSPRGSASPFPPPAGAPVPPGPRRPFPWYTAVVMLFGVGLATALVTAGLPLQYILHVATLVLMLLVLKQMPIDSAEVRWLVACTALLILASVVWWFYPDMLLVWITGIAALVLILLLMAWPRPASRRYLAAGAVVITSFVIIYTILLVFGVELQSRIIYGLLGAVLLFVFSSWRERLFPGSSVTTRATLFVLAALALLYTGITFVSAGTWSTVGWWAWILIIGVLVIGGIVFILQSALNPWAKGVLILGLILIGLFALAGWILEGTWNWLVHIHAVINQGGLWWWIVALAVIPLIIYLASWVRLGFIGNVLSFLFVGFLFFQLFGGPWNVFEEGSSVSLPDTPSWWNGKDTESTPVDSKSIPTLPSDSFDTSSKRHNN